MSLTEEQNQAANSEPKQEAPQTENPHAGTEAAPQNAEIDTTFLGRRELGVYVMVP